MSVLRPETSDDRQRQRELVERVAAFYGGTAQHMRRFSPFDAYLLSRDGEHYLGVIEVKHRRVRHDRYPTIPIEVAKVTALTLAAAPFADPHWQRVVGVQWDDGVAGVIDADHVEACQQRLLTLSDPRDDNDRGDLCYEVPIARFVKLSRTT